MHRIKELVFAVKGDTRQVKKELGDFCGLSQSTLRAYFREPGKKIFAEDAIRMRNFFRQHFPCEIDDLITTDDPSFLRKKGMVKISEVNAPQKPGKGRGRSTRAKATA